MIFEELKLYAADTNGDGTVDFDEFVTACMKRAICERYDLPNPPGASLADYINGLTTDLNKRFSHMIMNAAARLPHTEECGEDAMTDAEDQQMFGWIRVSPVCHEELYQVFCFLDADGSGGLDSGDLSCITTGIDGAKNARKNKVLVAVLRDLSRLAADTNDDGTIDFGEFVHGIAKKALEAHIQLPPAHLAFSEYFDEIERQVNTKMRALANQINTALQGP